MTGITMEDPAHDLAAVVRAETLGPLHIAGYAFGNFVACMLATVQPDVVRVIAMVAGPAGTTLAGESPYDPRVNEAVYAAGDLSLPAEKRLEHLRTAFFAPGNDPTSWLERISGNGGCAA